MPLDLPLLYRCLDEVESELIRMGRERHDFLREDSRLAAAILLLLRSSSMFRAMLELFQSRKLDAFDAVRRAFLESWLLAFQFRMQDLRGQAGQWLARRGAAMADIGRLEQYARGRGHNTPNLGTDYGELSNLAHPTRDAAENSASLILWRLGLNAEGETVEQTIEALEKQIPAMLYRFLWLVLDEDASLAPLHIDGRNLATAVRFAQEHQVVG
jgi:hypothetical protein